MKKIIYYYRKYGITQDELESMLTKLGKSKHCISKEENEIYPNIFTINRKEHKKKLELKKSKVMKKISGKPNPWNKDDLKKSAWIYKK